jgi:hypothetical protein
MLANGTYQTRNSRVAILTEPFMRMKKLPDDSEITVTGFRGQLLKADGKTPDSIYEWEDTEIPGTLGTLVRAGTEGVANEFDLVHKID